ncbi:hypothetical protein N7466_003342 [Penicillium verhagenii]|uniref:uncharacterized protein n=1 Tax=Penicillium verhagenii TaxID=1562060 RepID=UPI0025453DD4|nr:uncharacterized protein N7466_003342 [Penicillium verhagenii]KAJ5936892.1 hypothetical protein N7466_003342 [Penicillium verhagenii]
MNTPSEEEIRSIFGKLGERPSGYLAFFDHVADDVKWEITGSSALSGVWTSKSEFKNTVWLPIIKLIADPGPEFELVSTENMLKNEDGWVAVELKTVHTRTKLGKKLYSQHYCWLCKFNSEKKITQVRAFIDSSTAESVLSEEKLRQEAAAITPSYCQYIMFENLQLKQHLIQAALEASTKTPEYPAVPFDPAFKRFLDLFYLLTDAPMEHAKYVECFTANAVVSVGAKFIKGREGIRALRSSMWETVKERRHQPKQVFPLGPNSNTAMIYGVVEYVFKDESCKTVEWAAKCDFVKLDRVYLDRYQVFLADDIAWKSGSN